MAFWCASVEGGDKQRLCRLLGFLSHTLQEYCHKKEALFTAVIKIIKSILIESNFHDETSCMEVNFFHKGKAEKVK